MSKVIGYRVMGPSWRGNITAMGPSWLMDNQVPWYRRQPDESENPAASREGHSQN